jgi:hypothetical protein
VGNKVIFLDFDGPMVPIRAYWLPNQTKPAEVFDPVAVSLLNKLIEDSGAKLVISSSWRIMGRDRVVEVLSKNGIDPDHLHDDWETPRKFTSQRIHEIPLWLADHPEVTHSVAIDDESLNVEFIPNAVQADTYEGFSLRNYLEARIYLDAYQEGEVQQKEEHQSLIEELKRKEIYRLFRPGETNEWKADEVINEIFPRNRKYKDADL